MSRHRRELQQLTIDGQPEVVATVDLSPRWGGKRAGAGRPRTAVRTTTMSLRLPVAIYNALCKVATAKGKSPTAYARDKVVQELTRDIGSL